MKWNQCQFVKIGLCCIVLVAIISSMVHAETLVKESLDDYRCTTTDGLGLGRYIYPTHYSKLYDQADSTQKKSVAPDQGQIDSTYPRLTLKKSHSKESQRAVLANLYKEGWSLLRQETLEIFGYPKGTLRDPYPMRCGRREKLMGGSLTRKNTSVRHFWAGMRYYIPKVEAKSQLYMQIKFTGDRNCSLAENAFRIHVEGQTLFVWNANSKNFSGSNSIYASYEYFPDHNVWQGDTVYLSEDVDQFLPDGIVVRFLGNPKCRKSIDYFQLTDSLEDLINVEEVEVREFDYEFFSDL